MQAEGRAGTPSGWWRTAVVYQVYLRSFADADGDGIGDVDGLRQHLDHLVDLGVDALWITPWYPSPQADGGYDVADHTDVDAAYGTLDGARALVEDAHGRGLRVLLDVVPNHTSDRHPWFTAAVAAGPGSAERERYVFRPGRGAGGELPPTNWPGSFGGPAWTRLPDGEWYLHLFTPQQPDLNWSNPQVRADFEDILRFWFALGVDGFRIDVASGLVKDPSFPDIVDLAAARGPFRTGHPARDQDGVHEIWRSWRALADSFTPPRVLVGEAWVRPERLARYVRPDELHAAFTFAFLLAPWDAGALRSAIDETLTTLGGVGAPATWVLSNHDVVRHATRYGRAPGHELDGPGMAPSDRALGLRRARAAALLQLALPGSAYLYQGDELGLPEVEDLPDAALRDPRWEGSGRTDRGRDGCRVPLPWDDAPPSFGFGGARPWLPQPAGWGRYAVSRQRRDPASVLALYREALRLRRTEPGLAGESLRWLDAPDGVLAFARDPGVVCVVNAGDERVPLPPHDAVLLRSEPADPDGGGAGGDLEPGTAAWLRVARA